VNNIVLMVDDDDEFRETVGDILRDEGYEVLPAASSPQALEYASRHKPAICLLDIAMPGVDGIQLLRYFRSRHIFRLMPVIILTAGIRKDGLQQILQLGVKDVMLKSKFSAQDLADRIHRRIHGPVEVVRNPELVHSESARGQDSSHLGIASSANDALEFPPPSGFDSSFEVSGLSREPESGTARPQRTVSNEMIQAIGGMRALPFIVENLLSVAARPDASLADLELVVRRDPVVAARIVQAANSAAFMRGAPVSHLDEALRVLGFANITRIASTGSILRADDLEGEAGADLASLWRNSLATAYLAERLAPRPDKANAFLQGLLHDLPSMFALQYLGSDWLAWRSHALVKGWPLRETLSSALGCPLESLSGQILNAYRIPAGVAGPIQEFHEFFLASHPREPGQGARLLEISRILATALGRPGTVLSEVRALHRDEVRSMDLPDLFRADVSEEIAILEQIAHLPREVNELARIEGQVVLWRDPRWVEPDPVEAVLSRCVDCLRVEKFEELSTVPGRARIAMAEPGSLEWERLGQVAPVLVLHRGSLRPEPLPHGVETCRMPVPIHHLVHRVRKLFAA
jgi:CheY-like chemotaxis protein